MKHAWYSPTLVVEIPLEGKPRVFAVANRAEDKRRLLIDLTARLPQLRLDEIVTRWVELAEQRS